MSETRTACPFCAREPREFHSMDCPRFRRAWRPAFDWLAYSKLPIAPLKKAFRGFFQDPPKPAHSPGKPKRWRLAPIDPRRAMKPAEVRALDAARRAAR